MHRPPPFHFYKISSTEEQLVKIPKATPVNMYLCQLLIFREFYTKISERDFKVASASHHQMFNHSKGSLGNLHLKNQEVLMATKGGV
jgi:hypothetical protein